jgi:hypothetical protein
MHARRSAQRHWARRLQPLSHTVELTIGPVSLVPSRLKVRLVVLFIQMPSVVCFVVVVVMLFDAVGVGSFPNVSTYICMYLVSQRPTRYGSTV